MRQAGLDIQDYLESRRTRQAAHRGPGSSVGAGPQAGVESPHAPVLVHVPWMRPRQEVTVVSRPLIQNNIGEKPCFR